MADPISAAAVTGLVTGGFGALGSYLGNKLIRKAPSLARSLHHTSRRTFRLLGNLPGRRRLMLGNLPGRTVVASVPPVPQEEKVSRKRSLEAPESS